MMRAMQREFLFDTPYGAVRRGAPVRGGGPVDAGREQRRNRGLVAQLAGAAAEDIIATRYARKGYQVAARNWRGGGAEIDLILRDGDGLILVEVKRGRDFDRALEHFSHAQFARIARAATVFAEGEPNGVLSEMRFDLALVDGAGDVRILENFWP